MVSSMKDGSNEPIDFSDKIENHGGEQFEESPSIARGGVGSKIKRHCARFWWAHLIFLCAAILIIALCLVYVGMPRIAQSQVDKAHIDFFDLQFLNPSADSVTLSQGATLNSASHYTPTLDPFTAGLWLVTDGVFGPVPFVNINMPQIHVQHPQKNVTFEDQVLPIRDMDQLTAYALAVLTQEYVTTALTGTTTLHLGALPTTDVDFNSSSTYKGLNGLKGFNTTDLKLNLGAKPGTPNLVGNAFIPNPSVMTIEMGNVTLILSTSAGVVGNATIENFTVRPGDNNIPLNAIIEPLKVAGSAKEGIATLEITGNSSIYNGQHLVYYERALAANKLTLELNVPAILATAT